MWQCLARTVDHGRETRMLEWQEHERERERKKQMNKKANEHEQEHEPET